MTKSEYNKVISIIENYMTVIQEGYSNPRIVLASFGLSKVKQDLKEMVKEK